MRLPDSVLYESIPEHLKERVVKDKDNRLAISFKGIRGSMAPSRGSFKQWAINKETEKYVLVGFFYTYEDAYLVFEIMALLQPLEFVHSTFYKTK